MASALCCYTLFSFLLLLIAGLCSATDYSIVDFTMARKYELWISEHGRVYKDEAERARRFEIFKDNVKYIEDFNNAGEYNYTLGVNHFADLTFEEFLATYGGGSSIPDEEPLRSIKYETTSEPLDVSLPYSVDWRARRAVTPVMDQGQCGSCWSIAVAAAVEGLNKIKTGKLIALSAQQLIDCDRMNSGCKGGRLSYGFQYIINNGGITSNHIYPYTGVQGYCQREKSKKIVASIGGYKSVRRNDELALMRAVAMVPVSVAIDARSRSFQFYKSGVFGGPCGSNTNHAVLAVGYGREARGGYKYWIVKNSWGSNWGEHGYIRMAKDIRSPQGICGIATGAFYPTK